MRQGFEAAEVGTIKSLRNPCSFSVPGWYFGNGVTWEQAPAASSEAPSVPSQILQRSPRACSPPAACRHYPSPRARMCQHKPAAGAGLPSGTLTSKRGHLGERAGTVSLLTEPGIFIPHVLGACLFALLPGSDSYRNGEIAGGKEREVTPNLRLYFQASPLNYLTNWAPRRINTSRHQV